MNINMFTRKENVNNFQGFTWNVIACLAHIFIIHAFIFVCILIYQFTFLSSRFDGGYSYEMDLGDTEAIVRYNER